MSLEFPEEPRAFKPGDRVLCKHKTDWQPATIVRISYTYTKDETQQVQFSLVPEPTAIVSFEDGHEASVPLTDLKEPNEDTVGDSDR